MSETLSLRYAGWKSGDIVTKVCEPSGMESTRNVDRVPEVGEAVSLYGVADYVVRDRKYLLPRETGMFAPRLWLLLEYPPSDS